MRIGRPINGGCIVISVQLNSSQVVASEGVVEMTVQMKPYAHSPRKAEGRSQRKTLKIDANGLHVPLEGQMAMFTDEEIAAARGEVTDSTAREDK